MVLGASGGITGSMAQMLNHAAELAIRDRSECIGLAHLEHAGGHCGLTAAEGEGRAPRRQLLGGISAISEPTSSN